MGGTQALSRSLFSQLIPPGKEAEYFGFYEISDRGTSWLGPFLFALTYQLTESYRYAIFSLVFFFVVGGFLLAEAEHAPGDRRRRQHPAGAPVTAGPIPRTARPRPCRARRPSRPRATGGGTRRRRTCAFFHGPMDCGKSTLALQVDHNQQPAGPARAAA